MNAVEKNILLFTRNAVAKVIGSGAGSVLSADSLAHVVEIQEKEYEALVSLLEQEYNFKGGLPSYLHTMEADYSVEAFANLVFERLRK